MYHYTSGKNKNKCIASCYYQGFHSSVYDLYFDDLISSHIEYADYNDADYHCFNGDLKLEFGFSDRFAHGYVGLMKWYTAWYCLEKLGYDEVILVDIDAKFFKIEKFPEKEQTTELTISQPGYWHFTDSTWVYYVLYKNGATYENIKKLKHWYNTGCFRVTKQTNFKPYLDQYVNTITDIFENPTGLMKNTPLTGFQRRHRITAPYDEGFLQYFIALSQIDYSVLPVEYNTGIINEKTVLCHFTDKSKISEHCTEGSSLLNHSEIENVL